MEVKRRLSPEIGIKDYKVINDAIVKWDVQAFPYDMQVKIEVVENSSKCIELTISRQSSK